MISQTQGKQPHRSNSHKNICKWFESSKSKIMLLGIENLGEKDASKLLQKVEISWTRQNYRQNFYGFKKTFESSLLYFSLYFYFFPINFLFISKTNTL